MADNDILKLKKLLEFWIEHNKEHADEFKEWAQKARKLGKESVCEDLLTAAQLMAQADISLDNALKTVQDE